MRRVLLVLLLAPSVVFAEQGPARRRRPGNLDVLGQIDESQQAVAQINQQLQQPNLPPAKREELTQQRAQNLDNIDKAASSEPKNVNVQARAMGAFMAVKEPARALPRAEAVVALAPGNPEAYVLRGQVKRAMNDFAGAEEDAKRALKLAPNNKEAQALYALTHGRGGYRSGSAAPQPAKGAGSPAAAPAANPAATGGRTDRAAVSPAAIAPAHASPAAPPAIVATAAANADRLKAFDFFKQAQSKSGLGDQAAAKTLLDKAAAADPANPQVLAARAQVRVKLGDAAGGFADADAALMLDGKNARAYLSRAAAREALGHTPESALRDYKLAAELDPDLGTEYQTALVRLGGAKREAVAGAAAEDTKSGALPPLAKKALPLALIGLGLAVVAGAALKLKRDADAP